MENKIQRLELQLAEEKARAKARASEIKKKISDEKKRIKQEERKRENHYKILAGILALKVRNIKRAENGQEPLNIYEFVESLQNLVNKIEGQNSQNNNNSENQNNY